MSNSNGPDSFKFTGEGSAESELPKQVAKAFKAKLEEYVEENSDSIFGSVITDYILELTAKIRQKFGAAEKPESEDDLGIRREESQGPSRSIDDFGGEWHGTIFFQGEPILKWSAGGDGYAGSIDSWDDAALNRAMQKYVGKLKGEVG